MSGYAWIFMNGYFRIIKGYFRIIMHIMPAFDPAGNSIWFSALSACSGVQLDRDLFLHVLCSASAGYQLRQVDPIPSSIYQQKTHVDINYRGIVVQPAGQYAQGTGFNTGTMQCFFFLKGQWIWKNIQGYEEILVGWLARDVGVGAVYGKLAMDIYHGYDHG